MGQALYRKYRSRKLAEVVGQEHITKTLAEALKQQKISHAYLFSGPRGVGKTSVARILAHEVNKLSYKDDFAHLDILEIDAASNRRIDEIRDLRQRVNVVPSLVSYKVYIIDEVHMLTREAFNALLKTLEEPPAHVIFILATTEAHKLPETIISRTQHFNFKPVSKSKVADHLGHIAASEGINIDDQALELLAEHGEGSFRDSIGMLDQLASNTKKIDETAVRVLLGLPSKKIIASLLKAIASAAPKDVLELLNQLQEDGSNASTIASELSKQLRQLIIDSQPPPWALKLLRQLAVIPASQRPQDELEICLIEASARTDSETSDKPKPDSRQTKSVPRQESTSSSSIQPLKPAKTTSSREATFDLADWPAVITAVKSRAASLYTALRLASPTLNNNNLVLAFNFPLHQKKVAQPKNLALVEAVITEVSGAKVKIDCLLDKTKVNHQAGSEISEAVIVPDQMPIISNIFPAAEMLES